METEEPISSQVFEENEKPNEVERKKIMLNAQKISSPEYGDFILYNTGSNDLKNKDLITAFKLGGKKLTAAEIKAKLNPEGDIRKRGSNKWTKRDLQMLESLGVIDIIIEGNKAYFVGEFKRTNSVINSTYDLPVYNLDFGMVIDISNKRIVEAQLERLTVGDKSNYDKIVLNGETSDVDGLRVANKTNKSYGLFVSVPKESLELKKAEKIFNSMIQAQLSMRDFLITLTEDSEIGRSSKFKEMALHVHTKDVANYLIEELLDIKEVEEMQKIQSMIRSIAGLGPMSGMTAKLQFAISQAVRTKKPEEYYDYSFQQGDALREEIRFVELSVPITPKILITASEQIAKYKQFMTAQMINLYNLAMNPELEEIPASFDIELKPHKMAGITQQELDEFQNDTLPKLVIEAGKRHAANTRRDAQKKFSQENDFDDDIES